MGPRWRYLVNEVGIGLRRNLLMTLATIVTVTVSLALLGAGLLVQKQVNKTRELFYSQVEVSIFLLDSISEQQRASLEADLVSDPEVDNVIYVSKQQAYEDFQRIFADDPTVRDSVTPEILPASFRVKLRDPTRFAVIQSKYSGYPGIEEVSDQREVLDRFFRVMDAFRNGALVVAVLQLLAATALIFNTIRVTAFARREQTGIMKLVGATNWYIRLPFVLEGIVAGVVGALMATALLQLAVVTLVAKLRSQIQFLPFITASDVMSTMPILVLIGAGLASIASVVALRRFLAV